MSKIVSIVIHATSRIWEDVDTKDTHRTYAPFVLVTERSMATMLSHSPQIISVKDPQE